jgi:hypothetical protein
LLHIVVIDEVAFENVIARMRVLILSATAPTDLPKA